jgi:hypothetical protein
MVSSLCFLEVGGMIAARCMTASACPTAVLRSSKRRISPKMTLGLFSIFFSSFAGFFVVYFKNDYFMMPLMRFVYHGFANVTKSARYQ